MGEPSLKNKSETTPISAGSPIYTEHSRQRLNFAKISLVLGILSISATVFQFLPIVSCISALLSPMFIPAIIFGHVANHKNKNSQTLTKKEVVQARIGLITGYATPILYLVAAGLYAAFGDNVMQPPVIGTDKQ